MKKIIEWDGKSFESITSLSKYLNVPSSTLRGWLKRGITGGNTKGAYLWEGKFFLYIKSIEKEYKKSKSYYRTWLSRGCYSEQNVKDYSGIKFEGISFKNFTEARKQFGVNAKLWNSRDCFTFEDIENYQVKKQKLGKLGKPFKWSGKVYNNKKELQKDLGVTMHTVDYWRSKGFNKNTDLNPKIKPINFDGVDYISISRASKETGYPTSHIKKYGKPIKMSKTQKCLARRELFK